MMKLSVRDLTIRYGHKVAIDHVSLDIPEHQVVALIGPSGCGKTTLLRAMNRMHDLVPTAHAEGQILLDGDDLLRRDVDAVEVRRRVGMVFQSPNPFPKSIFDNVAFGLRVAGERDSKRIDARVRESLTQAALWDEVRDRLGESAMTLSGGQRQRLCIARAIATKPEVLLLDEPASALDPLATDKIEELVIELAKHYTIVIVTHSMNQAKRVSHRAAFFWMGDLVEYDATETLFANPREQRTHDYIHGRVG